MACQMTQHIKVPATVDYGLSSTSKAHGGMKEQLPGGGGTHF